MSFARGYLNAHNQYNVLKDDGLEEVCLGYKDVLAASMDGCSKNLKTISLIEEHQDLKWMMNLCFSHCGNKNAGQEARFPVLDRVCTILQKIFAYSEKAKNIWED
jgi:hypothetical protein